MDKNGDEQIDEVAKALDLVLAYAEHADGTTRADRGPKITVATTVAVRHLLLGLGWAMEPASRGELLVGARLALVKGAWQRLMDMRAAFEATLPD